MSGDIGVQRISIPPIVVHSCLLNAVPQASTLAGSDGRHWPRLSRTAGRPSATGEIVGEARNTVCVLVIDHQSMVRLDIAIADNSVDTLDVEILLETPTYGVAMATLQRLRPRFVALDLESREMDTIAFLREVRRLTPETRVVGLARSADGPLGRAALAAGAVEVLARDGFRPGRLNGIFASMSMH